MTDNRFLNNEYYKRLAQGRRQENGHGISEKKADSLLEKHLGVNSRVFLENYLKSNPKETRNIVGYLSYLSNLANLEQGGKNIENLGEQGEFKRFYNFLKDSFLDSRIKKKLLKWNEPKYMTPGLTTLVSEELFNEMKNYEIKEGILIGKKYYDERLDTHFDVLIGKKNIEELPKIDAEKTPIVPCIGYKEKDHQEYFLSLNERFPEIKKAFLEFEGMNPFLYKLTKSFGEKKFIPDSYEVLF
jgi:hypothetical protein